MFRRKANAEQPGPADDAQGPVEPGQTAVAGGPYDADEVPAKAAETERVDLGSLLVAPAAGRELRLQVDESTGAVAAVLLTTEEGALELRAFAAPRNGDLWSEVVPQLEADIKARGGQCEQREGTWGAEVLCQLPVQLPDGQTGAQVSRMIGFNGPRWLLRATFIGRPAVDLEHAAEWEEALTSVVVRRGTHALPVGEALPIVIPPEARPA